MDKEQTMNLLETLIQNYLREHVSQYMEGVGKSIAEMLYKNGVRFKSRAHNQNIRREFLKEIIKKQTVIYDNFEGRNEVVLVKDLEELLNDQI